MRVLFGVTAIIAIGALTSFSVVAEAHGKKRGASKYAKTYGGKGPKVRGYVRRRGGYSYSISDTINTYGDSRSNYGSTNVYRDPMLDRQTTAGPFDHGFFFDSGIGPRGGDGPNF